MKTMTTGLTLAVVLLIGCADTLGDPQAGDTAEVGGDLAPDGLVASDDDVDSDSSAVLSDGSAGGTEDAPMIDEAALCDIPESPRLTVAPGDDLTRATMSDPQAVCNDGTPAVFYVRRAREDSPDADKWIVWLEGGGGCYDPADCADRWCGRQSMIYSAGKMSSAWAPERIRGAGIFDLDPRGTPNQFAGYNMVMAYYCSSDGWSGSLQQELSDASGRYPDFTLYLHGSYIVTALIEALQEGAESDDGTVSMPSIDTATQVIFAGTSAGGGGVRMNGDRVAEMLRATNPEVDVRLVIDAGVHNREADPPLISEAQAAASLDTFMSVADLRGSVLDASCLAYHADDPSICVDNTHTLLHHVLTPWYVKMDLTDRAARPGAYPDARSFARANFELMTSLAELPDFSEENGDYVPGVFAPACGHHVNLESSDFYRIGITREGSQRTLSNHDVLWNWVTGDGPTVAIHDPSGGFGSVCP